MQESKLLPPLRRNGAVSRGELISSLEDARAPPLVLLCAGPGWGKTTLLAQWASMSKRPFAWVSVDEKDNDPIVLLAYVAVALDRVSRIDSSVFETLARSGVSVEGALVPRLGAALATMSSQMVLVLDDVHLLSNAASLDAIHALMGHVSEGSQIALSTRGQPALPLAAMRTKGLALEIGQDDLRMSEGDARELLNAEELDLADDRVAELTEQAEGWPTGLYLAALSIRAQGLKGGTATFSGSDRLVSDYLREELLAHLPADDLRFLTRTAVLERMSGPLCDEVLGESGSAAILESHARSNLFVVPLDANGGWYRYHHLFQELLRSDLARAEPDLEHSLLARASRWCELNGHAEAAVDYAQQAGDVDRVARLVAFCALPVYQSGRVATAERWLRWLEAQGAFERNAAVAVLGALLATAWGRPAEADRWAKAAEAAGYDGVLPDGSASIESWLAVLRAQRSQMGVAGMCANADYALRTLAPSSPLRPHALALVAVSQWLAGEVDRADDLLADAVEEALELRAYEVAAVALGERAAVAIGRGRWVEAEELAERALSVVRRWRMDEYPTSAFVCAVAARVALHRAEAQGADELLARAQRLRPGLSYALPALAVQCRLQLAHAYLTMADAGGAETMLREIEALLRRQPDLGTLRSEVDEVRSSVKTTRAHAPGASTLTEAELRLIPYLTTHLSFREIGGRLCVSRNTVRSQAMAVYRKLSVTSRSGAVERARGLGLV